MVNDERIQQEGIDSKALFVCFVKRLPMLLTLAVTGAIIGSGLNLILALIDLATPLYVSETEYYIDFAPGRYEAKDYYNAFTWNDVVATDPILGKAMTLIGDGYEREDIRNMITAHILSDVRYLTIIVSGEDIDTISKVRDALQIALESFSEDKDEFDSIYLIEDLGIEKEKPDLFVWRAALLGAVLLLGVGIFVVAFKFSLGDSIYTKTDITKYFGIPAYGLLYSDKNDAAGRQEKMLANALARISEASEKLIFTDAADGKLVNEFIKKLDTLGDHSSISVLDRQDRAAVSEVIIIIPFGVPCRTKITDEINYLELLGCHVKGAVLAEADKSWTRLYYNIK